MNSAQLQRLRAHHHTLAGQAAFLETIKDPQVPESTVRAVADELEDISREFPELLPSFRREDFFSHDAGRGAYYRRDGLVLQLQRALGRVRAEVDIDAGAPVTEVRQFAYVTDAALRTVISEDYQEAQRAFIAHCWKATIILSGSLIEALLLFAVSREGRRATDATAAPRQNDVTRWSLSDLINVGVELNLIRSNVEKLSHSVREYRNLVHPGNGLRTRLTSGEEEARIALEVLHLLDRELSAKT